MTTATVRIKPRQPQPSAWPRIERCRCGDTIMRARGRRQGHPFRLDPIPVLPEGRCGTCRGTGRKGFQGALGDGRGQDRTTCELGDLYGRTCHAVDTCPVCQGTGRHGEPLTPQHILVNPDGIARRYDGTREPWEAAYRPHRCR